MIITIRDEKCPHEFDCAPVVDFSHEWMCRHCGSEVRVSWQPDAAGRSYEDVITELAANLAKHTGWTFNAVPWSPPEPFGQADMEAFLAAMASSEPRNDGDE